LALVADYPPRPAIAIRAAKAPSTARWKARRAQPAAAPSTWSQKVQLARDLGAALVLWAPIVGYGLLGAYFKHIGRFPADLSSLAGLASVAFGLGALLAIVVPLGAFMPAILFLAWRKLLTSGPMATPKDASILLGGLAFWLAQIAIIVLLMAISLVDTAHEDALQHWMGVGIGFVSAIVMGLLVGQCYDGTLTTFARLGMALAVAAAASSPMFFIFGVAEEAPRDLIDGPYGVALMVLLCIAISLMNVLWTHGAVVVGAHGVKWLIGALFVLIVLVPSWMKQTAWFPTRIATMAGIRTTHDVVLRVPAAAAEEFRQATGNCLPVIAEKDPPLPDTMFRVSAHVLSNVGPLWRVSALIPAACKANAPEEGDHRVAFELTGTGIRQMPEHARSKGAAAAPSAASAP